MTEQEILDFIKKAQIDTTVAAGIVSPQDAAEFIDLTREQTAILDVIRVESDIRKSLNLDTLTLGEPVVVAGQEGTEPDAADVVAAGRSRATLTPSEILAAFDVTYSWLRTPRASARPKDAAGRSKRSTSSSPSVSARTSS